MANLEKILIVDDDKNLLSGIRRQLREHFEVTIAVGGAQALEALTEKGPFAVIVSDMRMPEMTGVELLGAFKERAPETVRMMLTGNADQNTAADAINSGSIFRVFTKPCAAEDLIEGITAGIKQYRLQTAEKELLEHTLAGSLKLLSDMMSFLDPHMTRDIANMRKWGRVLARIMKAPRPWEIDFACMLCSIGQISVPSELLLKQSDGEELSEDEHEIIKRVPEVGKSLISNIPRLSSVADAILYQDRNFDGSGFPEDGPAGTDIPFAGRALKVLKEIARLAQRSVVGPETINSLEAREGAFDPEILTAMRTVLQEVTVAGPDQMMDEVSINMLRPGQELQDDLLYEDGKLLLAKKTVLSDLHISRLILIAKIQRIKQPIRVTTPPVS